MIAWKRPDQLDVLALFELAERINNKPKSWLGVAGLSLVSRSPETELHGRESKARIQQRQSRRDAMHIQHAALFLCGQNDPSSARALGECSKPSWRLA